MHITKFRISAEATGKLRMLSQRAGLTPNLLCRMAMMSSFEAGPIQTQRTEVTDGQEFNAYTLFGSHEPIYLDLLRFIEAGDDKQDVVNDELLDRLRHHIDRGIQQLTPRIKSPSDAALLIAGEDIGE